MPACRLRLANGDTLLDLGAGDCGTSAGTIHKLYRGKLNVLALLPSQAAEFKKSGKLPHTNGKCLVCSRYVHTYIYKCARADPTFKPNAKIPLQAYGNSLGVECGENIPTHSSVANDSDGYRQEALLFVDEVLRRFSEVDQDGDGYAASSSAASFAAATRRALTAARNAASSSPNSSSEIISCVILPPLRTAAVNSP